MRRKNLFRYFSIFLLLVAGIIYYNTYFTNLGTFLFSFSLSVSLILVLLSFLRQEVTNTCAKFAAIWIPLSFVSFLLAPKYRTGGYLPLGPDKEFVAQLMAAGLLVISLLIIAWKSFQLRDKS